MLEEASEEAMKMVEAGQRDLKRQTGGDDDHSRPPDVVAPRG
jgi:hypothetical protein